MMARNVEQLDVCVVCHNDYSGDPEKILMGVLSCRHYYHFDCIWFWLINNSTCPICRTSTKLVKDAFTWMSLYDFLEKSLFRFEPTTVASRVDHFNQSPSQQPSVAGACSHLDTGGANPTDVDLRIDMDNEYNETKQSAANRDTKF